MNKRFSKILKVGEIIKPVDAYGKAVFYRPDGTLYDANNIMIYLVKLHDDKKTLAGKINGKWYEAFTEANGVNIIKVM